MLLHEKEDIDNLLASNEVNILNKLHFIKLPIRRFKPNDTTPSVAKGNVFLTAAYNTADGMTITNFDNGVEGQIIVVISSGRINPGSTSTSIAASEFILTSGTAWDDSSGQEDVGAPWKTAMFILVDGKWRPIMGFP